jgi:hypothetical protein
MRLLGDAPCEGDGLLRPAESAGHQGGLLIRGSAHCRCALPGDSLAESSITIDGINITTLPRQLVRSRLNAIPQEPFSIRGSVRANADPYQLHTNTAIISAMQKVQL